MTVLLVSAPNNDFQAFSESLKDFWLSSLGSRNSLGLPVEYVILGDKKHYPLGQLNSAEENIAFIHLGSVELVKNVWTIRNRYDSSYRVVNENELKLEGTQITITNLVHSFLFREEPNPSEGDHWEASRFPPTDPPVIIFLFVDSLAPNISEVITNALGVDVFGRSIRKVYVVTIPLTSRSKSRRLAELRSHFLTLKALLKINVSIGGLLSAFPGSQHFAQRNQLEDEGDEWDLKQSLKDALNVPIGSNDRAIGSLDLDTVSEIRAILRGGIDARSVIEIDPETNIEDDAETAIEISSDPERQINTWIEAVYLDGVNSDVEHLLFNVDTPYAQSLTSGPAAAVSDSEIPVEGLKTKWVVVSDSVEFLKVDDRLEVSQSKDSDGKDIWTATFDFFIPKRGKSETVSIALGRRTNENAFVEVRIFSRNELYRKLSVDLTTGQSGMHSTASIKSDECLAHSSQLDLRPTHEWTTPPGTVSVAIVPSINKAIVNGTVAADSGVLNISSLLEDWNANAASIDGAIKNVIDAAESFRAKHESYLDNITEEDLQNRLERLRSDIGFGRPYNWGELPFNPDASHKSQWESVSRSPELRDLATNSRYLYALLFTAGSRLANYIETMLPGHRINIAWTDESTGWIPHVPWSLLYLGKVPPDGEPIDPLNFWGLRFRIEYIAHSSAPSPRDLGRLNDSCQTYFLYWGSQLGDKTSDESNWQKTTVSSWENLNNRFVPSQVSLGKEKSEALAVLEKPGPPRTNLLYFFCQSRNESNNDPVLRFGSTNDPQNVISRNDLIRYVSEPFEDRPIVFLNACSTSSPDAHRANLLEQSFFQRSCRAYIGTECKVPIVFASRFAVIFFEYFYRRISAEPISSGEAFTQARLFMLTQYFNIGGLFYNYTNSYDLFMADNQEITKLRS